MLRSNVACLHLQAVRREGKEGKTVGFALDNADSGGSRRRGGGSPTPRYIRERKASDTHSQTPGAVHVHVHTDGRSHSPDPDHSRHHQRAGSSSSLHWSDGFMSGSDDSLCAFLIFFVCMLVGWRTCASVKCYLFLSSLICVR